MGIYAPTNLALTVISTSSIKLTWTINGYYADVWYQWVRRSTNGTTFSSIQKLNDDIATFTDTGLASGTKYYYYVEGYSITDTSVGVTDTENATTATSVTLAAPTGLTAIPLSGTTVEINFTDNSIGEDYHKVERDSVVIASLAPAITYYLDTGRTAGTTYTYRVRDQKGTDYGTYSSSVTATPPKPFTHIAYGTGTAAEGIALTALTTETARAAATVEYVSTNTTNDTLRFSHEFTAGSALTVTEVGVFDASASGNMLGRELLATPVTVAEGDLFMVKYDSIITDGGCGG